jgi:hypothetical protein
MAENQPQHAESVVVPRSLLFRLYRAWLNDHGCYDGDCDCNQTIKQVQALLRHSDGQADA